MVQLSQYLVSSLLIAFAVFEFVHQQAVIGMAMLALFVLDMFLHWFLYRRDIEAIRRRHR